MNALGDLVKNIAPVRDELQDRSSRVFFGVSATIPSIVAQGMALRNRTFLLSDLWGVIVRHAIQIGVLRGVQLCRGQHPKTLTNPRVMSDVIVVQCDGGWRSELVAVTGGDVRNRQIIRQSRFARILCLVTASKGRLSQLISEISTLSYLREK